MVQAILLLAASLLSQADGDGLVGRWTFDGGVKDSGPGMLPTKAVGRLEFIDSPIGGVSKTAVFNGVDAYVQVDPAGRLGAGKDDLTLSAWVFPLEKRSTTLFSRNGWSLTLSDAGSLRWSPQGGHLVTPPEACPPGQWSHVVLVVCRGTEHDFRRLYINGVQAANLTLAPGPDREDYDPLGTPLLLGKGFDDKKPFCGLLADVRLWARCASPEEIATWTDRGIPWIRSKPHAKIPFPGKFELLQNDVIAFVGGENSRVGLDLGYLETLLALRSPGRSVRFRNMAWEGDTVHEQPRPLNFGTWTDQFRRVGATVVFAQFGQLEALEGKAGLERFVASYESLLEQFARTTKRIVLVSPTPFGKGSPRQPDLSARNEDLKLYVDAIRKLAAKNGYLFVDLTTKPLAGEGLTRDGLHLTTAGHWIAAKETVRQLEIAGVSDLDEPNPQGAFPRESTEALRTAVRAKNLLWNNSWRPTNWSFLNGDRTEQPSSRDHLDRRVRWFPVEIQQFPAMVRREEEKIEALIQASEKK